jgi:hypothetical protein
MLEGRSTDETTTLGESVSGCAGKWTQHHCRSKSSWYQQTDYIRKVLLPKVLLPTRVYNKKGRRLCSDCANTSERNETKLETLSDSRMV